MNKTSDAIKQFLGIEYMEGNITLTMRHDEQVEICEEKLGHPKSYLTLLDDGTFCIETLT